MLLILLPIAAQLTAVSGVPLSVATGSNAPMVKSKSQGTNLSQDEYSAELRRVHNDPTEIDLPPKLEGISAHRSSNREIRLDLATPNMESLCALLRWLPPERELFFWDEFYPQITDPGAGVSVQRDHERIVYRLGNHGWSSSWNIQSCELLASLILLNVAASAPRKPLRSMRLSREPIYWLEPKY